MSNHLTSLNYILSAGDSSEGVRFNSSCDLSEKGGFATLISIDLVLSRPTAAQRWSSVKTCCSHDSTTSASSKSRFSSSINSF